MVSVSRVEYAPLERSVVGRFTPEGRASVSLPPVDVDTSCAGHRASRVPDSAACCTDASPAFSRVVALSAAPLRPLPNRCLIGCSPWPLRLWMIKVIRHVKVFTVSLWALLDQRRAIPVATRPGWVECAPLESPR